MGLMSPEKMIVAKIVSHRDLERKVLLGIEEFGAFEFLDVRRQAGLVEVKRSREEETVFTALDRFEKIVLSLDLETNRSTGQVMEIDDSTLLQSLEIVSEVITSIETEVLEIDTELMIAKTELERQRGISDVANSLKPLGVDPSLIGTTDYTFTTAGLVPSGRISELEWSLQEVTEGAFTISSLSLKGGAHSSVITVPIEMKDAVERILSALEFEVFPIPEGESGTPEQIVAKALSQMESLEEEIIRLQQRKTTIGKEWGFRVLAAWETLQIEKQRIEIKSQIVYTDQSIKVWGWIPESRESELEPILRQRVGAALEVSFDKPDFADHEAPSYISNPSVMKPTEDVVKAFGIPSRHDLDPTKIMFLSFPLIFGLVFADVGQGFLILLIGLAAWRANKKGDDWGAILGYVQNGAYGLMMMGVFAIFGGFLFGSFFGAETVIEPLWPTFAHYINDGHGHLIANPYRATHMLKLSIEIGAIHIMIGIILNIYNQFKHREKAALVVGIAYLWLYYGFINLLFGVSYNSVNDWFNPTGSINLWVPIAGIGFGIGNNGIYPVVPIAPLIFSIAAFIVPMVIMALASFKGGMDGIVLFLEYAIGMISHTVSYARIFALNTVHIILSGVFFSLIPAIIYIPFPELTLFGVEIIPSTVHSADALAPPGPHLPLLGAIIGTFIVGILEGLLGFMHTLRLHFVEWFSKFYHAGGVDFMPFYAKRIHTSQIKIDVFQQSYAVQ
ncbi:MAG: V-type ATPase 116kDa subunit family protein [Candidatus Thorarchaeota archaeon]